MDTVGSNMETFFTADTHLGHNGITSARGGGYAVRDFETVEEMDKTIINNWNTMVSKRDLVYHLGDFSWHNHNRYRAALNGSIILILGNHDKMSQLSYNQFSEIHKILERKIGGHDIVLCHYALKTWHGSIYGAWHLYGHSHGTALEPPHSLSFDVGVDVWDFYPVPMETIERKMKDIEKYRKENPYIEEEGVQIRRAALREQNRRYRK